MSWVISHGVSSDIGQGQSKILKSQKSCQRIQLFHSLSAQHKIITLGHDLQKLCQAHYPPTNLLFKFSDVTGEGIWEPYLFSSHRHLLCHPDIQGGQLRTFLVHSLVVTLNYLLIVDWPSYLYCKQRPTTTFMRFDISCYKVTLLKFS